MTAILSTNNPAGRDNRAPAPILRTDGTNYSWRMFFDNNQRILDADTTTECLDYIIDGYQLMTPDEKKEARLSLAKGVQFFARGVIVGNVEPDDDIEDWEWAVLTYGDAETGLDPYGWADGSGVLGEADPEVIDVWSNDKALVLVDNSYVPFTDINRPMSTEGDYKFVKNIIWLEPEYEESFLRSLSRIGYITFGTARAVK